MNVLLHVHCCVVSFMILYCGPEDKLTLSISYHLKIKPLLLLLYNNKITTKRYQEL